MAKVNVYISNEVHNKITAIVEKRRQEGARDKDISFSGTSSMLLELGLRVYEAQMERKESPFNQTEFNKVLLENVLKTQSSVAKILGIGSLSLMSPEIQNLNMQIWLKISKKKYLQRWKDFSMKMKNNSGIKS